MPKVWHGLLELKHSMPPIRIHLIANLILAQNLKYIFLILYVMTSCFSKSSSSHSLVIITKKLRLVIASYFAFKEEESYD